MGALQQQQVVMGGTTPRKPEEPYKVARIPVKSPFGTVYDTLDEIYAEQGLEPPERTPELDNFLQLLAESDQPTSVDELMELLRGYYG